MKRIHAMAALSFSMFALTSVMAADGYVTGQVNMRAGPDLGYPSVITLDAGTEVSIQGCVNGWSWCDVITGDNRGWVGGNYLQEDYQGQRVFIPSYGAQIGIPVITFVFGSYWDSYYRNRPWYGQREHWSHVTPDYRPVAVNNDYDRGVSAGSRAAVHGVPASDAGPSYASHVAAIGQPRTSVAPAAQPVRHATTSSTAALQHHAVAAGHTVTQAKTSTPRATPVHAASAQKTSRANSPAKSDAREEGGDDKDKH
ncbi:SH3 domain-containing protein [Dyella sp. 20L07]|uniref:SH3 domain-containing protein n=1 Tax=Dyella sp. 20L07 TaxID=3384240 RepID=UPI003D2E943B